MTARTVSPTIRDATGTPREGLRVFPGNPAVSAISGYNECTNRGASAVLVTPRGVAGRHWRSHDMDTVRVPLSRGKYAVIDAVDADRVLAFKWYAHTSERGKTYAFRNIRLPNGKRTTIRLHRFILNAPDELEVDHRDGDGLNCTRANIRLATRQQNCANMPKSRRNTSGYIGVSWDKAKSRWTAQIKINGRAITIGRFKTAEEAARARGEFARKQHGEFASRDEVA